MLDWADVIFLMERRHKEILKQRFTVHTPAEVLNIEDNYDFGDEELISILKQSLGKYLFDD